jgi:pyruvate-formate lyase-activating enzyme
MITKCNYCDYQRTTHAPISLLQVSANEFVNETEDAYIWMNRLVKTIGTKDYASVKIHMGRMHKDKVKKYEMPKGIWEADELAILEKEFNLETVQK